MKQLTGNMRIVGKCGVAGFVLTVLLSVISCQTGEKEAGLFARIDTNRGRILIALAPEKAPMTVMNFVGLAEGTIDTVPATDGPFYDGLTFHRVEPDFVIQGGDPKGNGSGGPGYQFPTETSPELLHDAPGVVAMANSGPDTNGSQFYITLAAAPHLDGGYNVFGRVVEGMDVVRKIQVGDTIEKVRIIRSGDQYKHYVADTNHFHELIDRAKDQREREAAEKRQASLRQIAEQWPKAELLKDSGIFLERVSPGTGDLLHEGDAVSAHVSMSLLDGTVLSDTRASGQPFSFTYLKQRILPGLEIALGEMREGARVTAIVPPALSFGTGGRPPVIPPDSYIVFDIERLAPE